MGKHAQPECDILCDGHMPEQRVMLEHESHVTVGDPPIRYLVAMQENSSMVGPLQSRQNSEQGGLAATGGAEERDEFSGLCMKAHVIQDGERAESFGDTIRPGCSRWTPWLHAPCRIMRRL